MLFNPKITIPGLPDQIVRNTRIGGQTEVVDSLLKRVVLINRSTMQLIAAKNVSPDNTWEMYALDQGNQNHLLIGMDEGANFNVSAFDRVSMGTKTYNFSMEDYGHILSSTEAFYVADAFYTDLIELPTPVMLPGELSLEKPVTDLYFVEDALGAGWGHFENGAGTTILAGRPQDSIREGSKLIIGGWTYTVFLIQNNGDGANTVKLDWAVSAADPDVLGDGSCVGHMPMKGSWVDTTGNSTAVPDQPLFIPFYHINYNNAGVQVVRDFTGIKAITFKSITSNLDTYGRVPIFSIKGVLEIGWYYYLEYLYVESWIDEYSYNNYTKGPSIEAFISIVFEADRVDVYFDNTTTPKKSLPVYTLSSKDQIVLYGRSNTRQTQNVHDNSHARIWDFRLFDKELSSAEMVTVEADVFSSYPIPVNAVLNAQVEGGVLRLLDTLTIPYTSNFEQFSPFYGTALNTLIFEKKAQLWYAPMGLLEIANNIINVPGDYVNLQDAINAAQNNDVIKIQPATYSGAYSIVGKIVHFYGDTDNPQTSRIYFSKSYNALILNFESMDLQPDGKIPVFFTGLYFYQNHTHASYYCVRLLTSATPKMEINFVNSYLRNIGTIFWCGTEDYILLRLLNCTLDSPGYQRFLHGFSGEDKAIIEKCYLLQELLEAGDEKILIEDYVTEATEGYGVIDSVDIPRLVPTQFKETNPIYFSIPADTVDEDLQNVQVPIDLSPYPNIFETASGVDEISVIFQDGQFLNVEVESWDTGLEKGLLWVTLPHVSSTSDTHYAVVYPHTAGLTGTLSDEVIQAVWDDFLFAYHMGYDPVGSGSCKDSTANENHATPLNMAPGDKSFAILGAYEYSYDGADQYLNAGNLLPEKTMAGAMEIVFKTAVTTGFLVSQDADGWNDRDTNIAIGKPTGISNTITDGHLVFEAKGPALSETNHVASTVPVNDNAYHHAALSWYRENLGLTLDGAIDVPQIEYKMWGADGSTDIKIGTNGTGFFDGTINDVMLSKKFQSAPWHEMFNKNLDGSLVQYAVATDWLGTWAKRISLTIDHTKIDSDLTHFPVPIVLTGTAAGAVIAEVGGPVTAKSVILDIADNWGDGIFGLRSVDFWFNGSKITLAATDFTAYGTSKYSSDYHAENAFDTSLSKTGGASGTEWYAVSGTTTNQRLIVVFDSSQTFDGIRINNSHWNGNDTTRGSKNVVIHYSTDSITDTTYAASIPNSTQIFDGQFDQHIASNVEDEQILELPIGSNKKIAVGLPDQSQLYCEIEQWDTVNDKITLWVSRSDWVISSAEDTTLYLYYDGAQDDNTTYVGDPGDAAAQNVWADSLRVWHTNNNTAIKDSAGNGVDIVPFGTDEASEGHIKYLSFADAGDYIPTDALITPGSPSTIAMFVKLDSLTQAHAIVAGYTATAQTAISLNSGGTIWLRNASASEVSSVSSSPITADGVWHLFVLTYDGTTLKCFVDGQEYSLTGSFALSGLAFDRIMLYPANSSLRAIGGLSFLGVFDTAKSIDWIKANYHAQTNTLLTAGTPQEFGGVAAEPWTPASIETALWLDAADETTLTLDASNNVSQWVDKSGNAVHAGQVTESLRPGVGTLNTLSAVSFTNDKLTVPQLSTADYYYFVVSNGTSDGSLAGASNDSYLPITTDTALTNLIRVNNVDDPAGSEILFNGEAVQSAVTRSDLYAALVMGSPTLTVIKAPAISQPWDIGQGGTSANWWWGGSIGEFIVAPSTITVEERQKIEGYLAHKWGLETNLPSGHPYKESAPETEISTGAAPISFNASQVVQNLPVKIDLSATSGADEIDMTSLIEAAFTNLQVKCNTVPVKAEAAYWVSATRAIIWALIPETVEGENTLALEYLETASDTIGGIGSTVGQEVWQDFEAVYHLCQDPAVGILDSTGNHANAVPANMDDTNLVDGAIVFNGTDEAINIGNIFDTQQDRGQAHVGFKTAENSGIILSQGDSDMVLDVSGNLVVSGSQTETSLDVLSDGAWHGVTFAFHRGKRDFFVDGVDQIPYGLFGSTGTANVLIGGHYTVGADFTGNIVDVRLNNDDPGHQPLSLRGKMWKEILDPTGDHIDMIPIFSFDQGSTYKIWTGTAWRAVVSNDATVHGVTGDTDWYYRDDADTWSKAGAINFTYAASLAVEYENNQNDTLTIETLTSAEWSETGGMTADGYFDMTFVFRTPIQGLYSAMSDVYADGGKQVMSQAFDLEPFDGKITGSKIEWKVKMSDTSYDYSGVTVYACLTGGTWTECTRNEAIPVITAEMVTTGLTLQFKIVTPVDFPAGSNILLTPKIF